MRRNIPRYNAARTDHTAFPNGHTAAYHYIGCKPTVVLYGDGLGVFQIIVTVILSLAYISIFRQQRVHGRGQRHIGTDYHIVADAHRAYIQTREVEIGPAEPAEGGIAAVIKIYRSLQAWNLSGIGQELA